MHLLTLGVLVMTAIGAALQLLPIATRQPLRSTVWPRAIWWLYTPGVAAVTLGMGLALPRLIGLGALAVLLALLAFAALLALNLLGARGMPEVVVHGWVALASLMIVLASALALVLGWLGLPTLARQSALALHLAFAAYGFMGLLALGVSCILVPMFALAKAPERRLAIASCSLAVVALLLAAMVALDGAPPATLRVAIGFGAAAVALHLGLMRAALRSGMRRKLGRSFMLVRLGWACLVASLVLALAIDVGVPLPGLGTLFGLTLVGGWLLSFVLGMLQRIVPFLATMHAARGGRRPPTPSALTADRPLAIHFACHLAALAGLAVAASVDSPQLVLLSAGVGAVGAAAFGTFFVLVLRRMKQASAP